MRLLLFKVGEDEAEVPLFGEGKRNGELVTVIGEVRYRIYEPGVEAAMQKAKLLAPLLPGTPIPLLFGFVIHPSAKKAADRLGAIVISPTGRS